MKKIPIIMTAVVITLLTACATKQYRQAERSCKNEWMMKIPPRMEQEMYNKSEMRQVPDGTINCSTYGSGYYKTTNCTQGTKLEYYTVPAVRTVDRNKPQRDLRIKSCTEYKCYKTHGNAKCK